MSPALSVAASLSPDIRQDIGIQALARTEPISHLAAKHGVVKNWVTLWVDQIVSMLIVIPPPCAIASMSPALSVAASLSPGIRQDIGIQVLARTEPVSHIAATGYQLKPNTRE